MPQSDPRRFDPRQTPVRVLPRLLTGLAGLIALYAAWETSKGPTAQAAPAPLDVSSFARLEHRAFTEAEARPGLAPPKQVAIKVRNGETLEQAVRRTGVGPAEAKMVVGALSEALDVVEIDAGLAFDAAVAEPRAAGAQAQLVGLTMRTSPVRMVSLSRAFDGALRLRAIEEKVIAETAVAQGEMNGSLYASAAKAGVDARITGEVVKLFGQKIDFSRDIKAGDPFRLVFDRTVTEDGRVIETGDLLYAEVSARGKRTLFYRFDRADGAGGFRTEWFDEFGKNVKGFLLRTPVDGARITSAFGMRRHPILGYSKMHQGIDFGAGSGTPVYAAGDGVVVEARRWGGYGNWLRIRHAGGWETGYAHLSRYASGLKAGQTVRQGQVVAYVGSTGASTGPHLHYETWFKGQRIDPKGAKVPQGTVLAGAELAAFRVQKARVDALLREAGGPPPANDMPAVQQAALRGAVSTEDLTLAGL
jgi:murein DD-endopeptidase MepM/ murein hydrolase activator NlpD